MEELKSLLNPSDVPEFKACALSGDGVFETLKAVAKQILIDLKKGQK
jgi:hypothetical protein